MTMSMRRVVFAMIAIEVVIWIALTVWVARQPPPRLDIAGMHGIGVFFIIPALLIAAWGRWLPFALGLVSFAAFVLVSVLIAGQISN